MSEHTNTHTLPSKMLCSSQPRNEYIENGKAVAKQKRKIMMDVVHYSFSAHLKHLNDDEKRNQWTINWNIIHSNDRTKSHQKVCCTLNLPSIQLQF